MTRRVLVKWLHWVAAGLMLYFFIDEPHVRDRAEAAAKTEQLSFHAGMGMILGLVALVWFVVYLKAGPLGRPGPKLPGWGRQAHRWLNSGLYWLLPAAVLSGALAGLASEYPVLGFGAVPLNPTGWGERGLHHTMEEVHEIVFNATILMIVAHAAFHVWRHYGLRDNALRIMMPRVLHRFL